MKVLTFGTFDLLHKGHISYLKQARKFGDRLYVLVACDQAVKRAKGYMPEESDKHRLKNVKKLKFIYKAWIGEPVKKREDYLRPILKVKPDVICLGYDQAKKEDEWLKRELSKLKPMPRLIRLKSFRPSVYKSSLIKERML